MKATTTVKHPATVAIRELEEAMSGGHAHVSFQEAVKDIPEDLLGETPAGLPYSIWQLVEHVRIAQWDILEFSRDPGHKSPDWPEGYWPKEKAPASPGDWKRSLHRIEADRKEFIGLLHEAGEKIYSPFPHGDGQSLFREAALIIDHTGYHTAEIVILRRLLGNWR